MVFSPIYEALSAITGVSPDNLSLEGVFISSELNDEQFASLQEWASVNARPSWSTGIGVIEAAESLVREAMENGNISKSGDD